jgi:hypothetical protein
MPQLSYSQNAIIAQPGMLMDGPDQAFDKVSRICSQVIPFGALCEMDANGNCQLVQDSTTLAGTVTVTNGSASATFTTAQTLPAGQPLIFSDQPSVVYYLAAAVAASTAGTLTVLYSGTGGAGKLASLPFTPKELGIAIFDPLGEEENYVPWSVPVTLAGTVDVTNGSASITFSQNQTIAASSIVTFASQPGVPYFIATAIAASTAGTLTSSYLGTSAGATTTTLNGGGLSSCPGYKIGRSVPLLRRGRIWGLLDGAGTQPLYGAVNVHASSTGANAQGVFTFSAYSQTVGNEIQVAPGCTVYQPNTGGVQPSTVTDPFGNVFSNVPLSVNLP